MHIFYFSCIFQYLRAFPHIRFLLLSTYMMMYIQQWRHFTILVFNRFGEGGGNKRLDPHKWVTNKKWQAALIIMFLYSFQRENAPILRITPHYPASEIGSSMTRYVTLGCVRKPNFSRHAAHSLAGQSTYTFFTFMKHTHRYQIHENPRMSLKINILFKLLICNQQFIIVTKIS